ncbi:DNA damage-inducible protein D [Tunturiibacter gelidoferens]|uniref:DNA-damage-inducible protein D n=1 Tax=Tunturiibacter lichenicola TaxID=2051959 RepID=A0A7Y9NQF0_9BACT|nr:DNA damage-inducible protein D [Edaphobacter lichenicola]NYF53033.1 DNA-damage-inducible protein D [Edaphobacter lichenicola]
MAEDLDEIVNSLDNLKKTAANQENYWMARDLQIILGYKNWENFEKVIEKGKIACEGSGVKAGYHFLESKKMIEAGKGARVERADWYLTRYACYLIAMNGESSKPEIAKAQTYFAVQTRLQEIHAEEDQDVERIKLRERVRTNNKTLAGVAKECGVQRFGIFNDAGYRGLYGMGIADIKRVKGIAEKDSVLDFSGRAELAAHDFRITQTESKLKREQISGEHRATEAHKIVGQEVREAIRRVGGTMPEKLPKETNIKTLISAQKKALKSSAKKHPKQLS